MSSDLLPVDVDLLRRGDVISVKTIEKWAKVSSTHRDYSFKIMELKALIQKALLYRGYNWSMVQKDYGLTILMAGQMSQYEYDNMYKYVGKAVRSIHNLRSVDLSELNDRETQDHERRLRLAAFFEEGVESARRKANIHR